jgi:hypothetical protein
MPAQDGIYTGRFGEWLTKYIQNSTRFRNFPFYFDHGNQQQWPNVAAIKGYYGENLSRQSQLAQVDMMIASPEHEIVLLIEIEENPSSPKKIVGDVFTILMCNHFAVRSQNVQHTFQITPATRFVFAGWAMGEGSKLDQLYKVISPRIQNFTTPNDGIRSNNVIYILTDQLSSTLVELQKYIETTFK